MFKKSAIGLMVLASAIFYSGQHVRSQSQNKGLPDLSGNWKLDKSKGNYVKNSGLKPDSDILLVISHAEPELKVIRKSIWGGQERTQENTYYSDGRGEVSQTFLGGLEGKSKSKWEGKKFVTRFSVVSKASGRGAATFDVIQEWKLSADGNTLTQTEMMLQTNLPMMDNSKAGLNPGMVIKMGDDEIKRVFHRTP